MYNGHYEKVVLSNLSSFQCLFISWLGTDLSRGISLTPMTCSRSSADNLLQTLNRVDANTLQSAEISGHTIADINVKLVAIANQLLSLNPECLSNSQAKSILHDLTYRIFTATTRLTGNSMATNDHLQIIQSQYENLTNRFDEYQDVSNEIGLARTVAQLLSC